MQVTERAVSAFQAGHESSIPFARAFARSNPKPQVSATVVGVGRDQDARPFRRARCVRASARPLRISLWTCRYVAKAAAPLASPRRIAWRSNQPAGTGEGSQPPQTPG